MRAYRLLVFILVLFISFPVSLCFAQTGLTIEAVVVADANLRAGPGTTYEVMGYARAGQLVGVTDYGGDWYQLSTGEWVAMSLVEPTAESRVVAFRLEDAPATANSLANLRDGPGIDYAIVGRVQAGQRLQVVAQNQAGDWFKLSNNQWIAAFLVNRVSTGLPIVGNYPSLIATTRPDVQPDLIQPIATPVQPAAISTTVSSVFTPTQQSCDPSYPELCIAPGIADLNCNDIPYRDFQVVGADPHRFDSDDDGIGCES